MLSPKKPDLPALCRKAWDELYQNGRLMDSVAITSTAKYVAEKAERPEWSALIAAYIHRENFLLSGCYGTAFIKAIRIP